MESPRIRMKVETDIPILIDGKYCGVFKDEEHPNSSLMEKGRCPFIHIMFIPNDQRVYYHCLLFSQIIRKSDNPDSKNQYVMDDESMRILKTEQGGYVPKSCSKDMVLQIEDGEFIRCKACYDLFH